MFPKYLNIKILLKKVMDQNQENTGPIIPLDMYLVNTTKNGQPCLKVTRTTTSPELIKAILSAAFKEQPIIIQPTFRNKLQSLATLSSKGIIYYNEEDGQYYFTI
jgi:hypothetical protein